MLCCLCCIITGGGHVLQYNVRRSSISTLHNHPRSIHTPSTVTLPSQRACMAVPQRVLPSLISAVNIDTPFLPAQGTQHLCAPLVTAVLCPATASVDKHASAVGKMYLLVLSLLLVLYNKPPIAEIIRNSAFYLVFLVSR